MDIEDVLSYASKLGIPLSHKSANRAWTKAAYLFVDHYICQVLTKDKQDNKELKTTITKNLLHHIVSKDLCKGCCDERHSFWKSSNSLPTSMCFTSLKRLKEKYSEKPGHSHISYKKENELSCNYVDWTYLPIVLFGIILPGNDGTCILKDNSAAVPLHCISLTPEYLNTISLMCCWNFIPTRSDLHQGLSFIELIDHPIVLVNLDNDYSIGFKSENQLQCSHQNFNLSLNLVINFDGLYSVSGYVNSIFFENGESTILVLTSKQSWENDEDFNQCCSNHLNSKSLKILLQHNKLMQVCLVCLACDDHVTITNLRKFSDNNSGFSASAVTTSRSRLYTTSLQAKLVEKYDNFSLVNCFKIQKKNANSICSLYIGMVSEILSFEFAIISLNKGEVLVFPLKYSLLLGIRKGSVIAVRKAHLVQVDGKFALVCCEYSSINVLRHSNNEGYSLVIKNQKTIEMHPCRLFSLIGLLEYLKPHISGKVLDEDWFNHKILHKNVSHLGLSCGEYNCIASRNLVNTDIPFTCVTVKMIMDAVFCKAKTKIELNQFSWLWKHHQFDSQDLFPRFCNWNDSIVLIGKVESSDFGNFKVSDGISSLKCIFLPCNNSLISTNKNYDQWKLFFPVTAKYIGSLIRINSFWIYIEKRIVSCYQHDFNSEKEFFNKNDICMVFKESDIVVLKSSADLMLKFVEKGNKKQQQSEDLQFSSAVTDDTMLLLFLLHKGPLLTCLDETLNFFVTALKYCESSEPVEYHIQFKNDSIRWFPCLFPTMLLEISWKRKDLQTTPNCLIYDPKSCSLSHITTFVESRYFQEDVVRNFYQSVFETWKFNHFASGLTSVFTTSELFVSPPEILPYFLSIRGKIIYRKEWIASTFKDFNHCHVKLTISTSGNCHTEMKIENSKNCKYDIVGLIPGAVVTFFRVKCDISQEGEVYCKYVPGSFHQIHEIHFASMTENSFNPKTYHKFWSTSISRSLLNSFYKNYLINHDHKPLYVEGYVMRILNVKITFHNSFVENSSDLTDNESLVNCAPRNVNSGGFSFSAKCMISDGSARAILHFGSARQTDFCRLCDISDDEWIDIVFLLQKSNSKTANYDCDLHNDKDEIFIKQSKNDQIAHVAVVGLFNDVNKRLLPSKKILMRHLKLNLKRSWRSYNNVDNALADGVNDESMFRIGTVPLESFGSTSVRSLSIKLIQFNCLSVAEK